MADACLYCEAPFEAPVERCPDCGRGQPVDMDSLAHAGAPVRGVPGGVAFLVGAILIIVGVFVPFVMLVGWIFVFAGAVTFAQAVWSRLEHDARPAD